MDIPSFLRKYPPFDALDEERLAEVVRHTRIEFFPEGAIVLQQSGEPSRFLYVIRTGAVELVDEGQVLDLLWEGEAFGHPSMLSGLGPTFTVRAHEDSLCYLIDREEAELVLSTQPGLSFLSTSLRRRVERALEGIEPERVDPWRTPVRALIRRPPVTCPATFTIREAAELMTRQRVSSLLVSRASGWGIITDRDLRSRVLAAGRTADTVVSEVCSSPIVTVEDHTILAEVMSVMLERGIHHVPVTDQGGQVLGVVTDTDLMGLEQKTPFQLKSAIERAADEDGVVEAGKAIPDTVCSLVEANVDPVDIGHVVAVAIDAMTKRLLELGIRRFGEPPCKWAWLALGSEARQEQALRTDQDNALAYEPGEVPVDAVDPYFEKLATHVNGYLEAAGIPRCRAGVNAENREWRRSVAEWVFQFRSWMSDLTRSGGAFTAIAFDYREVTGPLEVAPTLDELIRAAPRDQQFLRRIGRMAVDPRPPSGFLKDAVVHAKGQSERKLDVKHGGITLITSLARVYAVGNGLTENRTLRRLRDATELGRLDGETRQGLEEAFRLLWQIRLEHQVRQVREGVAPDDMVDPAALGPLARQGLKEAFRMIEMAQAELAGRLGVRR